MHKSFFPFQPIGSTRCVILSIVYLTAERYPTTLKSVVLISQIMPRKTITHPFPFFTQYTAIYDSE